MKKKSKEEGKLRLLVAHNEHVRTLDTFKHSVLFTFTEVGIHSVGYTAVGAVAYKHTN